MVVYVLPLYYVSLRPEEAIVSKVQFQSSAKHTLQDPIQNVLDENPPKKVISTVEDV